MAICIRGKAAGCGLWEIRETEQGYTMSNGGIVTGTFDGLRIPLELMTVTFGIIPLRETLIEAVTLTADRKRICCEGIENWTASELVRYLAYGNKDAVGVTGNWKAI